MAKDPSLLEILQARFEANASRHPNQDWSSVSGKITPSLVKVLTKMEETGGEPDVLQLGDGELYFVDCSKESPMGRRSLCYDQKALDSRKANKPAAAAVETAKEIGAALLNVDDYKILQQTGEYDLKTSSWIETPEDIRVLGGALFCDRRYDTVFTYHNGAESYYAARGFRLKIKI